jgi:hypothetical protein
MHIRKIIGSLPRYAIIPVLLLQFLGSCRPAKQLQSAISRKDTLSMAIRDQAVLDSLAELNQVMRQIKSNHIYYNSFSAKIKVEYEDTKGKQPNITANVRMIRDSLIWISGIATVFNVEAFRMLITRDSVITLDKINKEVTKRSIAYLQEITEIPIGMNELQNLIVGNPVFFTDSVMFYKKSETQVLLATVGRYFKHLLTLDPVNKSLIHSKLDDVDLGRNRTADVTYGDFERVDRIRFATNREITVSEKNKLDIQLKFKQYEFDQPVQINFSIPKNYREK